MRTFPHPGPVRESYRETAAQNRAWVKSAVTYKSLFDFVTPLLPRTRQPGTFFRHVSRAIGRAITLI